ncbi:hypothetical protein HPB51_028614 [Rhipicephalus microplus]|uniref:PiggyBac transposable element-derived protein domain-containing protein n=1 Tax=Rhipicephalus microplus TaxID=6941 RepID=A0A9J6CX20_RHIMP|nr:hypothetical protein HPB51_028614 [Rhipicephalus microplus]
MTDQNEPRDTSSDDKFWKVRPLLDVVRSRILQLEELELNNIDEQMVAFSGRVPAKQIVKSKPNPVGSRFLCGAARMAWHMILSCIRAKAQASTGNFSTLG